MTALVGLLFQSLGVNSFIIIRIMEPFWFLTALIMVLNRNITIQKQSGAEIIKADAGGAA
jgi:hypothetical protein